MKKINPSELCWWLLMGALIVIIGKIILWNELALYLHPKIHPFVYLGEFLLIVLFAYQLKNVFSDSEKRFKWGYFLFLIPMIMFILAGDAGAIIFKNRTISKNEFRQEKAVPKNENTNSAQEESAQKEELASPVYDSLPAGEVNDPDPNATDPTDPKESQENISAGEHNPQPIKVLNDDPFLTTLFNIDPEKESKVVLDGFVFRNEMFAQNEFYISRLTTNCCVAEAELIGMVVRSPQAMSFAEDEWVRVTGITKQVPYTNPATGEEGMETVLEATSIERIEALETPYVYFSF